MSLFPPLALVLALLAITATPALAEDDLGADARAAKIRWIRKVQEADVAYVQELEAAKTKAVRAGQSERAIKVEAEIEAIRAKFTASDGREILGEFLNLKRLLTSRKWKYRTKTTSSILEFLPNGTYIRDRKPPLKWEQTGDRTVTIHYIDGNSCTWVFPSERIKVLVGNAKSDRSKRWLEPL